MSSGRISQIQLMALGASYLMGTIVVSSFVSSVLGTESWMAGITGAICFLPSVLIYCALTKKYPGKGLFQMNEAVFGSAVGRVLSMLYLLFFISMCALNILEATNFLSYFIMPKTPMITIALTIALGCIYCVKNGITPLARIAPIFGIVSVASVLFNSLTSLSNADANFLLPLFDHQLLDYVQATHVSTSIPYGESIVLLMLIPDLGQKANIIKSYLAVIAFTAFIMILVHVRETISLGPMVSFPALPSYEVVRMINISNILTRTESLYALVLVSLTFFKTLILFYTCLSGITQIFRLDSYRHIVIMFAAFLVKYSINAYGAPSNNIYWGKNVSPFIWTFFTGILPLLTLVSSLIKTLFQKIRKKAGNEASQSW